MRVAIERRLPGALDPNKKLSLQDAVVSVVEAYFVTEKNNWDATIAAIEKDFSADVSP